ncbi:TPA: pili assembly chaperone [Klebsiella pneumoniae]
MIQKSMAMSGTTANYTLAESLRNMLSNKMFQVFFALLCAALFSSIALAGGDDGALGEIWTQLSEALSGAPGKALAACMLISAFYFSIGRPNPGLALVSFLMMMILANGEKIITGFLDAGVVL